MHNTRSFSILLLLLLTTVTGCIKEDLDDCKSGYNLNVTFRFPDEDGVDVFQQNVHAVDLFVYDKEGLFLSHYTIDQASLSQFQGTKLNLAPGDYTLVCWGNLSSLSSVDTNLKTLVHSYIEQGLALDGDPIHYGQETTITVPATGTVEETIDFRCAHRTVEVFVKGFTDTPATNLPQVELTQIPQGYDFSMNILTGSTMRYLQRAVETSLPAGPIAATRFHTPHFKLEDPIQIKIRKPSDEQNIYTVNMEDFLQENGIILSDTPQDTIQIMIEFTKANVKVTVPLWDGNETEPIF